MRYIFAGLLIGFLFSGFIGCSHTRNEAPVYDFSDTEGPDIIQDSANLIPVETFYSDYFPCSDCHSELIPNTKRRVLVDMHDDIIFDHDSANRWCLACHNTYDRDYLILAGGELLGFDESYRLCGQCHGPKYRDWKLGIHGKRTGEWNGKKQYRLCVSCHNPHSPKIKSLKPMPPPRRPENIYIDSINEKTEKISSSP